MKFRRLVAKLARPALVAVVAALAVAVQRDTFVRRWLLPPEPPASAALRRPVGDLRITRSTLKHALAQISVPAGARVVVTPDTDGLLDGHPQRVEVSLSGLSVIRAIDAVTGQCFGGRPLAVVPAGDTVWVGGLGGRTDPAVVRVHDIADLLPPPDAPGEPTVAVPPPAPARARRALGFPGTMAPAAPPRVPRTARQAAVDRIESRVAPLLGPSTARLRGTNRPRGTLTVFGPAMVIVAPEAEQARVAAHLADLRAEVQKRVDELAGSTTRPAR